MFNRILKLTLTVFLFIFTQVSYGQSESHDYITFYDSVQVVDASTGSPVAGKFWVCKVTMPRLYNTPGNADTASRHIFLSTPGAGQIQTGAKSDSNFINGWGPHFWLNNGWDGGIQLGNGKHYEVYITALQAVANTRPQYTMGLLQSLNTKYHPKNHKFDVMGFSQGSYIYGDVILYALNNVAGSTAAMDLIGTWTNLEGVGPEGFQTNDWTYATGFAKWAQRGGKLFGLEGTNDSRNIWQISQPMNGAVANTAFFCFQNDGGGAHCCWNDMYNPSLTDWRIPPTTTNPFLVSSTSPASTPGSYLYVPTTGTSIFQWILRQGDTSLLGGCNPIVSGQNKTINLPTSSVTDTVTATYQCGHTSSGVSWSQVSGPNTATIFPSSTLITTFGGLIAGTYVFAVNVTDNTALVTTTNVTIIVNATVSPTVSAGSNQTVVLPTSITTLTGTAIGNNSATITSTTWTFLGGPNTPVISSPSSLNTGITGLIQGTYTFKLTAIDNNGNSNSSTVTIFVTPQNVSLLLPIRVFPGEYQGCLIYKDTIGYSFSSNIQNMGTGGVGTPGVLGRFLVPAGTKMKSGFGGLHNIGFITMAGDAYTASGTDQGQCLTGVISPSPILTPTKITRDSAGNAFGPVNTMVAGFMGNSSSMTYVLRVDGTLWIGGDTRCGARGDGSLGDTTAYPVQIPVPGTGKIIQMLSGKRTTLLEDDGSVWTTGGANTPGNAGPYASLGYAGSGNQYLSWHQVTFPLAAGDTIVQIAGGDICQYGLSKNHKLYGYGTHSGYMGNAKDIQYPTPTDLTDSISVYLSSPISIIVTNSNSTHVVLTDSTLWGWGDNIQGCVGNGVEADMTNPGGTSLPYSIDPSTILGLPVTHPIKLTNKHNYVGVFGGGTFVYYSYATDVNDSVYSWGRGKGGILSNGVVPCGSGDIAATFSNSWDITLVSPVNFFPAATAAATCPICIGTPTVTPCNTCTITVGAATAASSNQSIATLSTTFDATGSSTTSGIIVQYIWSQISGPNTALLDINTGRKINVSNLIPGVYTFQLKVIDSNFQTSIKTFTISVSQGSNHDILVLHGVIK